MELIKLAFRNLGRNRTRTALSLIAVALGVMVVIMTKAVIDGSLSAFLDNTIRLTSGHIRIIHKDYRIKERLLSLNYPVEDYEKMVKDIGAIDNVTHVVPRVRFGAMASAGDETIGVMIAGVEPGVEERLVGFSKHIKRGRFIEEGKREVIMGYRTLTKLGLEVGDRLTLVFNTSTGSMKGYTFNIVGSIESGLNYLDDGSLFIPLDVAQGMIELEGAVTELIVMTRSKERVPGTLKNVKEIFEDDYIAIPWYEHSAMIETVRISQFSYNFIYFFILFLASLAVINTMMMVINERKREIGMLSALGLKPREILGLFLWEGGFIGGLGSAMGVLAGSLIVLVLGQVGIPLPDMSGLDKAIMLTPRLYPEFSLEVVLFAFFAGLVITLISVYGPAKRAANMEPTRALRG